MIGKKISHYEILEKIGEGGMGEVFLARDTRLGRNVALKFVPGNIHDSATARDRLIREATAASKLNHANIVSLYDIGEADSRDYIVMEYVDGRSLREVIDAGQIDLNRALDLARQVCRALVAAHGQNVVHRDIKSENILLTGSGDVKVLDFGLAKFEGAGRLTETGSTVGTVAYMSPEQVQGWEVDHRSDLFSLGVLLYEMVAGRRPFRGEHRAAVGYSIVNDDPEPLARYKASIPEELQRIVDKLLRKDRETRYQTAADLLSDLEALQRQAASTVSPGMAKPKMPGVNVRTMVVVIATVAVVAGYFAFRGGPVEDREGRLKIAVLPFENLGATEDEYFADGITEEITARLASIRGLGVIARTSVLQYKDTDKSIERIGDELDIDYILEGTVRWQKTGDGASRVRVTPQLIRVSDATHVWANVYDEPLTAVFDVQSDIATSVTRELNVALLEPDRRYVEARPTDDLEAYDFFLRGQEYFLRGENASTQIAAGMFEKAVERDPEFAEAYAMLSSAHFGIYWFGVDRTDERLALAADALAKAVELDPNSFTTRMAMGYDYYHGKLDYDRALEQFEKAKQLQPGRMDPYAAIGYVQRRQGKWEECLTNQKRALELDPRSSHLNYEIGETMIDLGRYEEAEGYLDRAIELEPDSEMPHVWKYVLSLLHADLENARAAIDAAPPAPWFRDVGIAQVYFLNRQFEKSLAVLNAATLPSFSTHFEHKPIAELKAHTYRAMGDAARAQAYFDSSRVDLEALVAAHPDDARYRSALGIAYAGLGRNENAVREGKRGVELMPVSKESKRGPHRRYDLALIYMLSGDYRAAVDELEYLLSIPASPVTVPLLRINPQWDPLRDYPPFQKLIE
jgi:non-specific serine/threonine protein kinase